MLTEEQTKFISQKIEQGYNDYVLIANMLHNRQDLTGRSKEAKEVRDYLVNSGFLAGKKDKYENSDFLQK